MGDNTIADGEPRSGGRVTAATYTLNVINAGSPTTSVSNTGLPTGLRPLLNLDQHFEHLHAHRERFHVHRESGVQYALNALAQAINSSSAGVNATVINLGSPSAPSYSLSLQSTALGNIPIQLNDGIAGSAHHTLHWQQAQYQVNGQPSHADLFR